MDAQVTTIPDVGALRPRLYSPDLLKATAIFGVVLIHSAGLVVRDGDPVRAALEDIARFAVPAFIVLWAYFFERGYTAADEPREYATRRFVSLFIPYAFWTAVYVIFFLAQGGTIRLADLRTGYWSGYGWAGQYFFIILFQLIVLFPLLRTLGTGRKAAATALAGLALYAAACTWLWTIDVVASISERLFLYWVPHVAIGVWAARCGWVRSGPAKPWLAALAFVPIVLIPFEFSMLRANGFRFGAYATPAVLAAGLLVPLVLLRSALSSTGSYAARMVQTVGQSTLGIFCINPLVVTALGALCVRYPLTLPDFGVVGSTIYVLIVAFVVLLTSLLLSVAIAATPLRRVVQA